MTVKTPPKTSPRPGTGAARPKTARPAAKARAAKTGSGHQSESPPSDHAFDARQFARNMAALALKTQELLADQGARLAARRNRAASQPLDPLNIMGAMTALAGAMAANPQQVTRAGAHWLEGLNTLWGASVLRALGGSAPAETQTPPGDRRFRATEWHDNAGFDFLRQSYLLSAGTVRDMVAGLDGIDDHMRARIGFFTRQIVDALAPTNFPFTNPDVLKAIIASNGRNLVDGMDNLLADIARGQGDLAIRQTADAFTVGENIAVTPGKVIFRNDTIELIQYAPATAQVYARPLLIFPPWINKFYILDLRPENSFVRWLVAQGYSVFLVSWVNPDGRAAAKGFEDYMREGIFAALEQVKKTTGVKDPNCVGYCIGGTLLAASLAFMAAKGDKRIHSATFWAAQTDFSEAGELSVFVDEVQLGALKTRMDSDGGVLAGAKMANAFNMLRANDLIWSFFINNYLLGKKAAPFDLLYWNSDTTRMPQKLHLSYLRECYLNNALARGEMELAGVKLDLAKITIPTYFQSAREDHIAPAASVLRGARLFGGKPRFILAGSGHIAGVINPPAAGKYQYWTRGDDGLPDALPNTLEEWQDGAHEHPGSWWPDWGRWLSARSGAKVAARIPGNGGKTLGDAPGTYVKVKAR